MAYPSGFSGNANDALFTEYSGTSLRDPGNNAPSADPNFVDAGTFYVPVENEILNLIQIVSSGISVSVINDTGTTINPGAVGISGYDATNNAWKAVPADATGPFPVAGLLILPTLLASGDIVSLSGAGLILGSDSGLDATGASPGDAVWLAVGGGITLTMPDLPNLQQQVGELRTFGFPGDTYGQIIPVTLPIIGASGFSGFSGAGILGVSGFSGFSGASGFSAYSGAPTSGYSGYTGYSGFSGQIAFVGVSGYSGPGTAGGPGDSGTSGYSGYSGTSLSVANIVTTGFMERTHYWCQASGFSQTSFATASGGFDSVITGQNRIVNYNNAGLTVNLNYGQGYCSSGSNTSLGAAGVGCSVNFSSFLSLTDPANLPICSVSMATGEGANDLQDIRLYAGLWVHPNSPNAPGSGTVCDPTTRDAGAGLNAIQMAAFRYAPSTGDTVGQWSTVTGDGSALTTTTNVGAITGSTSYNLTIDMSTAGQCLFYLNNALVATHALNLPPDGTIMGWQVKAGNTGTHSVPIALIWKKTHLSQR